MKTSELLRKIAARIQATGWGRGGANPIDGECVMLARPSEINKDAAARQIKNALGLPDTAFTPYWAVARWNDSQPDGATVIAALRSAADKAEREEGGQG